MQSSCIIFILTPRFQVNHCYLRKLMRDIKEESVVSLQLDRCLYSIYNLTCTDSYSDFLTIMWPLRHMCLEELVNIETYSPTHGWAGMLKYVWWQKQTQSSCSLEKGKGGLLICLYFLSAFYTHNALEQSHKVEAHADNLPTWVLMPTW